MNTAIVWFRNDLRLADNPALAHAAAHFQRVLPVFVRETVDDDPWPPGAAADWWLHRALEALDDDLRGLGSGLLLLAGDPRECLPALAERLGAAVFWNRRYSPAGQARDAAIKERLRADGRVGRSFNAALLAEPWEVATRSGDPYRVYTPFWKNLAARDWPAPLAAPARLPPRPEAAPAGESPDGLGLLPEIPWYTGLAAAWRVGEAAARERLQAFADGPVTAYDAARDRPGEAGTSRLSPYLHFGHVGPRQVAAAMRAQTDYRCADVRAFLGELGWREFAHHLLFHFPRTPTTSLDPRFHGFPWREEYADDLAAWQAGQTGIPIVDAGMRELWATGWMHNRVRMVVGSLLTKNLRIPWQAGARWFWDTLVDADLAANTLGWQWIAGCGADAAPYFRIFNPVRQGERFDPGGDYVRRWVPELARLPDRYLHQPWAAPAAVLAAAGLRLGEHYPHPLVDLKASRQRALEAYAQVKGRGGPGHKQD